MMDRTAWIVLALLTTGMIVMFLWSLWAAAQIIGCMSIPIAHDFITCGEGWSYWVPAA